MANNLSRYYTPKIFEEVGFMPFIALNENIIQLTPLTTTFVNMYIEMQSTVTYWFKWLDTSQISLFDFGLARRDYKVERQSGNKAGNAAHEQPVLRSICYQARRIT